MTRTVDNYIFFKRKIAISQKLQKKLVSNVISYLKENGFSVYVTCSVFKNKNEEVVNYISEELILN